MVGFPRAVARGPAAAAATAADMLQPLRVRISRLTYVAVGKRQQNRGLVDGIHKS